jgi:hypothetical protein
VVEVAKKWTLKQNDKKKKINWRFKTEEARIKLVKLYPTI